MKKYLILLLLLLAACANPDCPQPGKAPSYGQDVLPLVVRSCQKCHAAAVVGANRQGAPRGKNYDTYEEVRADAEEILLRVRSQGVQTMPPLASSVPRLSNAEIDLVQTWHACGAKP